MGSLMEKEHMRDFFYGYLRWFGLLGMDRNISYFLPYVLFVQKQNVRNTSLTLKKTLWNMSY